MLYDELPIAQKVAMMRVCIKNGITNPDDIRTAYNNYVEGRNIFDGLSESYHRASAFGQFLANGGHIYDGTSEPTGQMRKKVVYTSPYYPGRKFATQREVRQANWDYKHPEEKKRRDAALRQQRMAAMEEAMRKRQSDYLTTSNDNTWVESRDPRVAAARPKNPHLAERALQGAKAHAAWAEEHPVMNAVGIGLGALPFAVAAAPAVTVAGDAVAGSAVGQGITALLTNPYFDAAMTSLGGAHAAQSIVNGEADAMTALELMPMTRVVKPMYQAGKTFVGPAAEWASEGLGRVNQFMASPYTGKWTQFGGSEYRFKPGYLGMNGTPVESRAVSPWIKELPLDEGRYYRQVDMDALDAYRANGVISQQNKYGNIASRYETPMFTKGKPSMYRADNNGYGDVWVVSKPEANLEWESVKGAAMSPKYGGEFNKAPISEFEFYQYDPARGYIKLDEGLNLPKGISFSRTPHVDYLNGLSEEQQLDYLVQNGLNDQWLWTLKNRPDHLESALRDVAIPTENTVYSITPSYDYSIKGLDNKYIDAFRRFDPSKPFELKNKPTDIIAKPNNDFVFDNFIDQDKRFKFIPPSRYVDYDIDKLSAEELERIFGPTGGKMKAFWDIAKAHNFEGQYGKVAQDAKDKLNVLFPVSREDPDIALGLERSERLYSIPEYRERFNRWGTLGDTFVDDALDRLNNVRLQGIDGTISGTSMDAAGSTIVDNLNRRSPLINIRNTDSSSTLQQVVQHEGGHASHGTEILQPQWMKYHNEKIKPKLKPRYQNIEELDEKTAKIVGYQNKLDEIVTRSKTAVEYADRTRLPGESLDDALERVYEMTEKPYSKVPTDVKDLVWYFDKETLLNFWKNFVGGYAAPVAIGAGTVYGASQSQKKYGGWLKPLTL